MDKDQTMFMLSEICRYANFYPDRVEILESSDDTMYGLQIKFTDNNGQDYIVLVGFQMFERIDWWIKNLH